MQIYTQAQNTGTWIYKVSVWRFSNKVPGEPRTGLNNIKLVKSIFARVIQYESRNEYVDKETVSGDDKRMVEWIKTDGMWTNQQVHQ